MLYHKECVAISTHVVICQNKYSSKQKIYSVKMILKNVNKAVVSPT